jgi:putative hydrolase of the HAD superfamily
LPGIKAVLFDVYGTLLISSSGDIDVSDYALDNVVRALRMSGCRISEGRERDVACFVIAEFLLTVRRHHARAREDGKSQPEVDILAVWRDLIGVLGRHGIFETPAEIEFERLAFAFEMCSNPVYPMPGLVETIGAMRKRALLLGIVSNAQFFTPLIMNYFLSGSVSEEPVVPPFRPDLTVFSYQYGRAKPDPFLFEKARERLAEQDVEPAAVLFVGNDMRNDVWAAREAGFRTALFAGDRRSLRLRANEPRVAEARPDCVLRELKQLETVIMRTGQ